MLWAVEVSKEWALENLLGGESLKWIVSHELADEIDGLWWSIRNQLREALPLDPW